MDLPTLTISAGAGWLDQRERFSKNIAGKEQKNYTLLHQGELSYNHGNSKLAKYGAVFMLDGYKEALVPRVYHSFKVDENTNAKFIEYLFATKLPDRELAKLVTSGARMDGLLNINWNAFMSININLPTLPEQQKIGALFATFDERINAQQKLVDALTDAKAMSLRLLFPAAGSAVPKVRMAGFAGAWEERKFMDTIASIIDYRGRTPKKLGMEWSENEDDILALSAVNVKNGYIDRHREAHYGDEKLYEKWMGKTPLHKNQVLFTTEAPMGNVAQVPDDQKYILSQRTVAFNVVPELITEQFLATLLLTPRVQFDLEGLATGATAKGVSQKTLKELRVKVPKFLPEQQAIGQYFATLDEKIAAAKKQLATLEDLKATLLRLMFV